MTDQPTHDEQEFVRQTQYYFMSKLTHVEALIQLQDFATHKERCQIHFRTPLSKCTCEFSEVLEMVPVLSKLEALESIAYRLARHIRNTDKQNPITWGVSAVELLAELRELDPNKYDELVK